VNVKSLTTFLSIIAASMLVIATFTVAAMIYQAAQQLQRHCPVSYRF